MKTTENGTKPHRLSLLVLFLALGLPGAITHADETQATTARFAVIGDYGSAGSNESGVANLVKSWNPEFVITTGDNNYPSGSASTIDRNIGQYYSRFIKPYRGSYGSGSTDTNRFFPSLGNHDWMVSGAKPYLNYFTLPGNERYYDFTWGPVHFFAIDSDRNEPHGTSSGSTQATWLKNALAAAQEPWKVVFFHHPPYSSGSHGSNAYMRWPFKAWGASIVLSGHDHNYERIEQSGFTFIVNGLGGASRYSVGSPVSGSKIRYNNDYGAQLVEATSSQITFRFYSKGKKLIDGFTLKNGSTVAEEVETNLSLEAPITVN